MTIIRIEMPGMPQGKKTPVSRVIMPKDITKKAFAQTYKDPRTKKYEDSIAKIASIQMIGKKIITGPVKLILVILHPVTDCWPQWKKDLALDDKIVPTVKPDASNVLKSVEDAFTGVVWNDDAQVIEPKAIKRYSSQPCVYAVVETIDKYPSQITRNPKK